MQKLILILPIFISLFACEPSDSEVEKYRKNIRQKEEARKNKLQEDQKHDREIVARFQRTYDSLTPKPKFITNSGQYAGDLAYYWDKVLLDENMNCYRFLHLENMGKITVTTVQIEIDNSVDSDENYKVNLKPGAFKKIKIISDDGKNCDKLRIKRIRYSDGTFSNNIPFRSFSLKIQNN